MEEKNKSPIYEDAERDYIKGMKYKEIAEKYNVSINTVKSWKTRYKWVKGTQKSMHTKDEKVRTQNKKEGAKEIEEISWIDIENEYVTDIRKKPCTLEEISKKYNISFHTIKDHSFRDNWTDKRNEYRKKLVEKTNEKTADIISDDIAAYKAKHLHISDKVLNEIKRALNNDNELYTIVEKVKTGYGQGEFDEKIIEERLNTINDSKVVNLVNALDKLQKMQRQTLGVLDAKDVKEENNITSSENKPFELPARLIAPCYIETLLDIKDKANREYILKGGRGSTKSSFVSLEIIDLMKNNPNMHAVVMRKVKDTLRDSVYSQMMWAISALELEHEFKCSISPMEITYIPTGQKIYFRGLDEPTKLKGIKPQFGYIGIAWFEELDQYNGAEQVRSAEQSVIRGGEEAYIFKTFNPPKTLNNWANKYCQIPKESQYQIHTTYLDVPKKWLGRAFLDEAEHIKEVNPTAYDHEYLGQANGNGGNVFDNVIIRTITDDEISQFDRLYFGVDFGWYPDCWAFVKCYYNSASRILYIFEESRENKKSNKETYEIMINKHKITPNDKVICDSSEPKSIEDYRSYGLFARGAIKGAGSVDYSMKWLQSLTKIVVDNARCPGTALEFLDYEYERDKEGNVISGYPDKNNHSIDSVRYALNDIWKRKGM